MTELWLEFPEDYQFAFHLAAFFLLGSKLVKRYGYRTAKPRDLVYYISRGTRDNPFELIRSKLHRQGKTIPDNHECFEFLDYYGNMWGIMFSDGNTYIGQITEGRW
jgi:hypothetical protein